MMSLRRYAAPAVALLMVFATDRPAAAQRASTAVLPQTITVGDVFHAAVRVDVPAGAEIVFPDTLVLPADVELAGRMSVRRDSASGAVTAMYPLTAWRPDSFALAPITFAVRTGGALQAASAPFPPFAVSSVLPADTAGIEPKAAKDVLGANRIWWPLLLALLLALIAGALAYRWWRRRRALQDVIVPPTVLPRAEALAALDRLRELKLVEAGHVKEFYLGTTAAVRAFLATEQRDLTPDLTTAELAAECRLRRYQADAELASLLSALAYADLVKFAGERPSAVRAYQDWQLLRDWVQHYNTAPPQARAA